METWWRKGEEKTLLTAREASGNTGSVKIQFLHDNGPFREKNDCAAAQFTSVSGKKQVCQCSFEAGKPLGRLD